MYAFCGSGVGGTGPWQLQHRVAQIRVHKNLPNQSLNLILTLILTLLNSRQ